MQRKDSLGEVTKIHKPRMRCRQMFKSRRSHPSISCITHEGHSDLSVIGMKVRSAKNRDDDGELDPEARAANVTPTDPFEEGEQTLI